jgi:hypothetical protein
MKKATFLIFLFFFILYYINSAPGIVFGDSPELALSSYSLGIAHPPGYPLFSIITKFFSYLQPFQDYAKKCNTFSVFISSLTLTILFYTINLLYNNKLTALIATLTTGFSYIYFKQSLVTEVYALNSFFVILITFSLVKYTKTNDKRWLYLSSFIGGIGLGNHHTLIGILFSAFMFMFSKKVGLKTFFTSLLFLLLGITVYIYLPLRSLNNPILDWGNPENLDNFISVITREQFGFGNNDYNFVKIQAQILHYFTFLKEQFYIPLLLLTFYGFYKLKKINLPFCLYLLLIFLINGLLTFLVLNPDENEFFLVEEFLTPSIIACSFFIAFGIYEISKKNKPIYILIGVLSIIALLYKFTEQKKQITEKNNLFAKNYAMDTLNILPDNSVIIGEADYTTFPLLYTKHFYFKNKDITILDADFFMLPWYQEQNIIRIPFLKNVLPDIASHSKSKRPDKKIGFEDIELFKLDQSMELANNIKEKLNKHVFYTSELYEIAKIYNHELIKYLKPYGTVFIYKEEGKTDFNLNTNHFLHEINIKNEELFFLKPYIPYILKLAHQNYMGNNLENSEKLFKAIYKIDPTVDNLLNYALLLGINNNINEAKLLVKNLENTYLKFDPRLYLLKGIIALSDKDYTKAHQLLSIAEQNYATTCEAKLYIFKTFVLKNDRTNANLYYQKINECPDYIKRRLKN